MKKINGWYILIGVFLIGAISASERDFQAPFACLLVIFIAYQLFRK